MRGLLLSPETASWLCEGDQREQREAGAANYCHFSGEGRFVYIGKLLKVHISPEAFSLDLIL